MLKWSGVLVFALILAPQPGGAATLTPEEVIQAVGASGGERERFLAGEIVTREIEETADNQLAVGLAFWTTATVDEIADKILDGVGFEIDPAVVSFGEIDPASVDAGTFAEVVLDQAEIAALLAVGPGDTFNLSSDEIARFRAVADEQGSDAADPAVAEAVTAAYREMLASRVQAYAAGGLGGIAPYDRGGDSSSAAEDLKVAAAAVTVLPDREPELFQAFHDYPASPVDGVEHLFFWSEERPQDRQAFVLDHAMIQQRSDQLIVMRRTFYAGHSFNASQVIAGAVPIDQGLAILYSNRTATDQVAGFMSGMRRGIGRGMMTDQLVDYFGRVKAELER